MNRSGKYILTADDYGACDYIDLGVLKAIQEGKINSVACFSVPFGVDDQADYRIRKLIQLHQSGFHFGIGLHISLTAGRPANEQVFSEGNSLTEWDKFTRRFFFRAASRFNWGMNENDLETELVDQIERMKLFLGNIPIDSLSCHHGVLYLSNRLFKVFARVASRYNIPVRSPIIWRKAGLPYQNWDRLPGNPTLRQGIRLRFYKRLLDALKVNERIDMLNQSGILYPTCLVDEFYGQPYPAHLEFLFKAYQDRRFSAEFMFHLAEPAYRNQLGLHPEQARKIEAPHGIDPSYFGKREQELHTLLNAKLPDEHARLVVFRELVAGDEEFPEVHP